MAVPPPYEGRFAIVTSVGSGMRWTRSDCKTCNADPYGKSVWSWHPWAGAKSCKIATSAFSGRRAVFCKATVTKRSWTPRRARHKRSNHRAGNVDVSASSAVTTLVCFLHCTRGCGCSETPGIPCALLFEGASMQDSGEARRGNDESCRHSGAPEGRAMMRNCASENP